MTISYMYLESMTMREKQISARAIGIQKELLIKRFQDYYETITLKGLN